MRLDGKTTATLEQKTMATMREVARNAVVRAGLISEGRTEDIDSLSRKGVQDPRVAAMSGRIETEPRRNRCEGPRRSSCEGSPAVSLKLQRLLKGLNERSYGLRLQLGWKEAGFCGGMVGISHV